MNIRIRDIDFYGRRLAIGIEGLQTTEDRYALTLYLACCLEYDFTEILLAHDTELPSSLKRSLRELENTHAMTITTSPDLATDAKLQHGLDDVHFTRRANFLQDGLEQIEYTLRTSDFKNALDHVSQFVFLVGCAIPLDPSMLSRARLCLTELSMNSVDHADFGSADPLVEVTLATDERCFIARYKDNAKMFDNTSSPEVDIGEQIKKSNKRGLGLHMLAKTADELKYERKDGWNQTICKLIRRKKLRYSARRANMKDFSVEIIPMDSIDAVVLKTTGSINSNTAPTVDSHLDQLINQKKYNVIVDLSDTDFISSSGIGVFLGTVTNLRDRGGDLVLMNIPRLIDDIFEILNIRNYFRVIKSLDELHATPKA